MTGLKTGYPQVLKNGFDTNTFDFSALLLTAKASKNNKLEIQDSKNNICKVISQSFPARGTQQTAWGMEGGCKRLHIINI